MAIVPVVNRATGGTSTVTPLARRPRKTTSEGVAITGPFTFALRSSIVGQYRPGPNNVTVLSPRVALLPIGAAAPGVSSAYWGADTTWVINDIGTTVNTVADLYIKSIDADFDGYDDMEVAAAVSLVNCFATFGDGMLSEGQHPLAGSGVVELTASGEMLNIGPVAGEGTITLDAYSMFLNINPVAGSGALELSASGAYGVWTPGTEPIAGSGTIELSGSGAATNINPLAGSGTIEITASGDIYNLNPVTGSGTIELSASGAATADNPVPSGPDTYWFSAGSGAIQSTMVTSEPGTTSGAYGYIGGSDSPQDVSVRLGSGTYSDTQTPAAGVDTYTFTRTAAGDETSVTLRSGASTSVINLPSGVTLSENQVVTFKVAIEYDDEYAEQFIWCGGPGSPTTYHSYIEVE